MNIIKFKITTPSKLSINYNDRTVVVSGEVTLTPIFYANINDFSYWAYPFENEKIRENEKNEIIGYITRESKEVGEIEIIFD